MKAGEFAKFQSREEGVWIPWVRLTEVQPLLEELRERRGEGADNSDIDKILATKAGFDD